MTISLLRSQRPSPDISTLRGLGASTAPEAETTCLQRCGHNFCGLVWAAPFQVLLKLVSPFLHDADGRQRSGVAQGAERSPEHVLAELANQRDIFLTATAVVEAVEHLAQPGGALAARDTPAARLV